MEKKTLFTLLGILIATIVVFASLTLSAQTISLPDIPDFTEDWDGVNRCRCKDGGCYGGNAISFRAACAKSEMPIICEEFKMNCK